MRTGAEDQPTGRAVVALGWALVALGAFVASAWLTGMSWLHELLPGLFDQKINTAVSFMACGAGLLAVRKGAVLLARIAGGFVLALAAVTGLEYLTGVDLGIDQLFARDFHSPDSPYPGRMSPGTTVAFLLAGGAVLLTVSRTKPWRIVAMEISGLLVLAAGVAGFVGQFVGVTSAYTWYSHAVMAYPTAIGFMVAGAGLLTLTWSGPDAAVANVPLWVPAALCSLVLMLDLTALPGVAASVAYVPLVFCSIWFRAAHSAFVFAAVGSVLTVFSAVVTPTGDVAVSTVAANVVLTAVALWLTAFLVFDRRREAENAVNSEGRVRHLVEAAPTAIVAIDEAGDITLVNSQTEQLFGYGREELIGARIEMLVPRRYRYVHSDHRQGYLSDPQARPMGVGRELYGLRKDGSEFPVEIGLSPMDTDQGRFVLSTVVDISERREQEEALLKANDALERSNMELQRYAHVASHDLQTPIRSIGSFVGLLRAGYGDSLDDQANDWLMRIAKSTAHMQTLTRDLLSYSRLEREERPLEAVAMGEIFDEVVRLLDVVISETGAEVTTDVLPTVQGDRSQLIQLLQNLLDNALKYHLEGNTPRVHLAAERSGREWVFSLADNGIGIAPKHRNRIFEVFKRLHDQREFPGTGIGLAVCRRVVQRHGGRIWVESEPGQGSVFHFTLQEEDSA